VGSNSKSIAFRYRLHGQGIQTERRIMSICRSVRFFPAVVSLSPVGFWHFHHIWCSHPFRSVAEHIPT
jgi:hypothetical protein